MKAVYLKTTGLILDLFSDDAVLDTSDFSDTYGCEVGTVVLSLTDDEIVLCRGGRRKVNDITTPTGIVSV
jgi:hypothetical protein